MLKREKKQQTAEMNSGLLLILSCARRRTFLTGESPESAGSGKDIAVGKGVYCEVESEGSRMWVKTTSKSLA